MSDQSRSTPLETWVREIRGYEEAIAHWDESQQAVVAGLKTAIEGLHREAFARLIRQVKRESMPALRHAVEDEIVYALLRYHELIKPPPPPLAVRVQQALDAVRPALQDHHGDVELVAIQPPDRVDVRLVGTCSHCPASTLTLKQGVEQAIRQHCPEITTVVAVQSAAAPEPNSDWVAIAALEQIPDQGMLALEVAGQKLLVARFGDRVVAYHDRCSHLGKSLAAGTLSEGILTCPFHQFQYRLPTGECLSAPTVPLQPYPVQRRGDRVFAQLP